jgi:hypothetical protein
VCKNKARVEVTDSDKQPSLLQYAINYGHEKFYITGPCDNVTCITFFCVLEK